MRDLPRRPADPLALPLPGLLGDVPSAQATREPAVATAIATHRTASRDGPGFPTTRPPALPTLWRERALWRSGCRRVAGVDEVGVAPASGPVLAAAVIMAPGCRRIPGVRDSKLLSARQRERLYPRILRRAVAVGLGAASVSEIDRLNIYHATHLAMRRAVGRLGGHDYVLVDGLPIRGFEAEVGPYEAIVDGDAICYSIACASIVAKVVRDRLMGRLALRHPGYGWERNAGYATPEHRRAMAALGVTALHRRSFVTTRRALAGEQSSFAFERLAPADGAE